MVKYLKLLLWPFALLYGGITGFRNYLYDNGILKSTAFNLPVIAVGNLTVGGTGKTPHVEYLLRLLDKYKLATLSRGYKRKTSGFILADDSSTAAQLGDEPFQYHLDFPEVSVAVCEQRVEGVQKLTQLVPETETVVLDDAMQHRSIQPSLMIMLTDFGRPFFRDHILPAGLLRESRYGARRAEVVVVSKCPLQLTSTEMADYTSRIHKYTRPGTPVFYTAYKYAEPVSIAATENVSRQIILLTGIANPLPLQEYLLSDGYEIVKTYSYPDHHTYTVQDLLQVKAFMDNRKGHKVSIITTSKDAVKLMAEELVAITSELPVYYLPIKVSFLKDAALFDAIVTDHVKQRSDFKQI